YSDINRGDVNFDGEINQSDIDLVQQYISTSDIFELPYILPDTEIADVNRDGMINYQDVDEIARKIQ
uniref:dockerin type I repeat-containing protein n=1 Tax=Ruminococcus sp. TaxID=41978 RepID=UPI002586A74E